MKQKYKKEDNPLKNYLLYFFAVILWTALLPFSTSVAKVENPAKEPASYEAKYKVKKASGEIAEMTIDEYTLGVMLTEMPANYEKEALRAQAIAIRSYALYLIETNSAKHEDADLCSDGKCCRNYVTYDELCTKTSKANADERFKAMSAAVYETCGEALTYEGKTAMTLYHISSPAKTESYENVFKTKVPYLVSVDNVDESGFVQYKKEITFKFADFQKLLNDNGYQYTYTEGEKAFPALNNAGRCEYAVFGSVEIPASIFCSLAGLNSNCFEIAKVSDGYKITSYGLGSGLGMSQYGANILATQGCTYKEILSFYFKNTVLEKRK
jgi:stage II sporulation protein D